MKRNDDVRPLKLRNVLNGFLWFAFALLIYFNTLWQFVRWSALALLAVCIPVTLALLWRRYPPDEDLGESNALTRQLKTGLTALTLALCLVVAVFGVAHAQTPASVGAPVPFTLSQIFKGTDTTVTGEQLNADGCPIRATINGNTWEFQYIAGSPACIVSASRDAQSGNVWTPALTGAAPPVGPIDLVDGNGYAVGWAASAGMLVVGIHFSIDGDPVGGTLTHDDRLDVAAAVPSFPSNAGWHFQIPAKFGDQQLHELRAFALDEAGNEHELWGSPYRFQYWSSDSIPPLGGLDVITPSGMLIGWAGNYNGDPTRVIITVDDSTYGNNGAHYSSSAGNHITTGDARPDVAAVFPVLGPSTGWHIGFPIGMADGTPRKVRAWSLDANNKPRQLWFSPWYVSCQPLDYVRMYCVQVSPFAAAFGVDAKPDLDVLKLFDNGSGVDFTWSNCDPNLSQCNLIRSDTAQGAIDLAIAAGNAHPSILDGPRAQCSGLKPVMLFGPPANPIVYYSQEAALAVDAVYPAARNIALHTCGIGDGVGVFHWVRCSSPVSATTHGRQWVHVDNLTGNVPEERLCPPPPDNCSTVARWYGAACNLVTAAAASTCAELMKKNPRAGLTCAIGGATLGAVCTVTAPTCPTTP